MNIGQQLRPAIMLFIVLSLITGVVYPLVVTGIAQVAFAGPANGSLITNSQGKVIGSGLIGQSFDAPQYVHPRPSSAGTGYDASSSSGSNLGPTNEKLIGAVKENVAAYRKENGLAPNALVPADAVTGSGSGLDPDISPENAALQAARIARARGATEAQVKQIVDQHTYGRTLGFLGDPRVNVLEVNIALDSALPVKR